MTLSGVQGCIIGAGLHLTIAVLSPTSFGTTLNLVLTAWLIGMAIMLCRVEIAIEQPECPTCRERVWHYERLLSGVDVPRCQCCGYLALDQ